jgi:threonine dehydratase
MPPGLPTLAGIEAAHALLARLAPRCSPTPMWRSHALSRSLGADIWIKAEMMSPIGSFKWRGAITSLARAKERLGADLRGAATSSTGNHGLGVAYAARLLGLPSLIVLPEGCNPVKRARLAELASEVREVPGDIDHAKAAARRAAKELGYAFVDDGEDSDLIEGAGTVGLEIARALPSVDTVIVPLGSGSLSSGCGAALKAVRSTVRVIAAGAERSPAMAESFRARRAVERPVERTWADGLVCREPAAAALAGLLAFVDEAHLVTEDALLRATRALATQAFLAAEPSAAAPLAVARQIRDTLRGQTVALVATGGNASQEALRAALAAGE